MLTTRIGNLFQKGLFFSSELEDSNAITHQPLVFKGERTMLCRPVSSIVMTDDPYYLEVIWWVGYKVEIKVAQTQIPE